jgi:uncharacterized protein (TIGR02284 family)
MTTDNKDVISVLNDLIEISKDGEKGFAACAEDVKSVQLKQVLTKHSQDCAKAASELQQEVRTLGGDPETSTSVTADLHRFWVDIKSSVTGKDEAAILNEAERGEDHAKAEYKKALEKDLPANIRTLVERQYQGVLAAHDEIKALRNAARAS